MNDDPPQSPCNNICVMHPRHGICAGCYRTLDEIACWGGLSPQERRDVIDILPARKLLLKKQRGGSAQKNASGLIR